MNTTWISELVKVVESEDMKSGECDLEGQSREIQGNVTAGSTRGI